jgi:hypothetical protein
MIGKSMPGSCMGLCDVDGDPSRLVLRQYLRLPSLSFVVAGVEVGKRLPVGVPHDTAESSRARY